ncbi:MAG: response regulator transcription factor [Bacteroidota bacterium]
MKEEIRVAIVEDDAEIRQLFGLLLDNSPGYQCVAQYADAESALDQLEVAEVDVVLMDIDLPGVSGIQCTEKLKQESPELNIIMLTVHEDDAALFDSLCAGATGYILKETSPVQILEDIRTAHQGGSPMSSAIARRVIQTFHQPQKASPLSERETEVLTYLVEGQNYRTIAEALFVSPNTIKAHIKNIYRKLEVSTRAEAVSKAHKDRLI